MIKQSKKAFTLIELSVVVVIIAIMLTTVLVSKSLIISAKNNKIQEEYRMFSVAISVFQSHYDCHPGDCIATQIADIMQFMPGYIPPTINTQPVSLCTNTSPAGDNSSMVLNSGSVDSTAKRTCMMLQLQAIGFLSGLQYVTTIDSLINTVSGRNIPFAKFSRQASWDYRIVTGSIPNVNSGFITIPQANGLGGCIGTTYSSGYGLSHWCGQHALILRNSNLNFLLANQDITGANSNATYAVTANMAFKLDTKFDDGLPYTGNISGTRNAADTINGTAASCTTLVGVENNGNNLTNFVNYSTTNSLNNGCIVSYLITVN